ncbi:hypothetical protein VchM-138_0006 [Vibrio phage vB_VchM-138]|uniref:hypothetical protein n=1 Tax=Vibrio phage vB_VchM-138 TaxID=1127518 RepID=UPI0002536DF5|nr:hypothetical protein F397_gp06 [Vibrio phage vB_VchM-138]AFC22685.1 hypothetical protein VchM-138_0006 [Vibrio phage vB_VchM-138]
MIKFELPNDDALVLKHVGLALQNIAAELSGESVVQQPSLKQALGCTQRLEPVSDDAPETDTTAQQYASLAKDGVIDDTPPPPANDTGVELDVNGLPWDGRIHSANKTQNSDGSWRNARQPKNFDGDWAQYIKEIEAELKAATGVTPPPPPVDTEPQDDTPPPPPVDTEPQDDTPPPPPVDTEPQDDTPPPPPVDSEPQDDTPPPPFGQTVTEPVKNVTFAALMKLVTTNAGKDSVAKVHKIIADLGLGSLQTLNTANPGMVPTVYAQLCAKLEA